MELLQRLWNSSASHSWRSLRRSPTAPALVIVTAAAFVGAWNMGTASAADFASLAPLLQKHCIECHGGPDPDGGLALESFAELLKGGESGSPIVAGKSGDSLLIRALEGTWNKTGKNHFMPPGKRAHLTALEIAQFKAWIDAGAPAPADVNGAVATEIVVPKIEPKVPPARVIHDLAFDARSGLLAIARSEGIELVAPETPNATRSLAGAAGPVNAVAFSPDGQFVFGAAGWPNQSGEIRQWRLASGESVRVFKGPRDALHSLAVSSDGTKIAAGSYDYSVTLWQVSDGALERTFKLSQGAIMGLAFRPDGRMLASGSYDRTAKLLDIRTGTRLETFGHALKELNALAFSPDGRTLLTGGNDNRIRAYRISAEGREGSNELLATVFAHEGALLRVVYSPDGNTVATSADDRTVKLFGAAELPSKAVLETQPDWPTALSFAGNDRLAVGRADGTWAMYQTSDGKPWSPPPPPKPVLTRIDPRGVQSGEETTLHLTGQHLTNATVISIYTDHLISVLRPTSIDGEVRFPLDVPAEQARGPLEITVSTPAGESGRLKVWVDDLPQTTNTNLTLPTSVWGVLARRGQSSTYAFAAAAGQTLVLDLQGKSLGSPGDFTLALLDDTGKTLAQNDTYNGQSDPLLVHTFTQSGQYKVIVGEAAYGGSPDHFFRLSVGALPLVTGVFPPTVEQGTTHTLHATGYNLPDGGKLEVMAGSDKSVPLPWPDSWRSRRTWTLEAADLPVVLEVEPNGSTNTAMPIKLPVVVNGRLDSPGDLDFFRFSAEAGRTYVIETSAARRGSTADTRIEVLWLDGRPVERVRLQAVRNSAVTFRPGDSNESGLRFDNWEEMELNDLLYCGGEVMKIFRAPQGPDSPTMFYASNGRRRTWFDTTATAHYLDEPVYVVTPLAAGAPALANGLPVFTVYQANDDASLRDAGRDSRLTFTAPATGDFLVRVEDTQRDGQPTATYALTLRPAEPDISVRLSGAPESVARGSGQAFSLNVERRDGYEEAVDVEFLHLPPGWTVSGPARIEAGHGTAELTLNAAADAAQPEAAAWDAVRVIASSRREARATMMAVNTLGHPKLAAATPKIFVSLAPTGDSPEGVILIKPGGTARAKLSIQRQGQQGVVTFSVENLPHGVIVENLGLNGITFLPEESEREISLAAARWVSDLDRTFFAVENQAGRQTSRPLTLKVRRSPTQAAK